MGRIELGLRRGSERQGRPASQILERHLRQEIGGQVHELRLEAGSPGEETTSRSEASIDPRPGLPVRRALDQAGQQEVALLEEAALGRIPGPCRKQPQRLELQERRRDHQEAGRRLEIERLPAVDCREELVGDGGQGHVVDVDPLAGDQLQEQVDRALEHFELDLIALDVSFDMSLNIGALDLGRHG